MRLLAAIVLVGLAGCVTPSIPIPPPDPSALELMVTRDDSGEITSASLYYPPTQNYCGGVAYVFNRQLGVGIIETVKSSCAIGPTMPVTARANDELVISVENDDQTVSTCFVLTAGGTAAGVCQ
jgi:hypothetical protein